MEPEDNKRGKDEESASKQISDYYQKFSQNKNLPKYFRGTSISYIPEIVAQPDIIITEPETKCNENYETTSQGSSVTSNRKLEWDNGADIGYDNYRKLSNLQKSLSLPSLIAVDDRKLNESKRIASLVDLETSSSCSEEVEDKVVSSSSSAGIVIGVISVDSSSSSEKPTEIRCQDQQQPQTTSSSSCANGSGKNSRLSTISDTLEFIKMKIGVPGAESTPKECEIALKKSRNQSNKPPSKPPRNIMKNVDQGIMQIEQRQIVNLSMTKAISIECFDDRRKLICNKKLQTSTVEKLTKSVQTDYISRVNDKIKTVIEVDNLPITANANQSVVLVNFSESDEDKNTRTVNTQTNSDIVSNCNSFEYLSGDNYDEQINKVIEELEESFKCLSNDKGEENNEFKSSSSSYESELKSSGNNKLKNPSSIDEKSSKTSSSKKSSNEDVEIIVQKPSTSTATNNNNLKRSQKTSNLAKTDSSSSSNQCKLGQLIVENQSDKLKVDVEKSIELLQRLLNSKRYNSATKKFYIKKIVNKLINTKYMEDSSTTSSELFYPKKSKNERIIPTTKSVSTTSSESFDKKLLEQNNLQQNVPWYPVRSFKKDMKLKKLTIKTFNDEILPVEVENKFDLLKKQTANDSLIKKKSQYVVCSGNSKSSSIDTTNSSNNWRNNKTKSEILYEKKKESLSCKGDGDHLVHFARNEREQQLNWINYELNHLAKLKNLLEKDPKQHLPLKSSSSLEGDIKKSTTVYMISQNNPTTSNYSTAVNSGRESARNYIIQTELENDISSDQLDVHLYDKASKQNYVVKEMLKSPTRNYRRRTKILGDVEVLSDDKTTNIKIKTKKIDESCVCRKIPCCCHRRNQQTDEFGCMKNPCICHLKSSKINELNREGGKLGSSNLETNNRDKIEPKPIIPDAGNALLGYAGFCECCKPQYQLKEPSLVGTGRYQSSTFPRSNYDRKIQFVDQNQRGSSKQQGTVRTHRYIFEIPSDKKDTSLTKQINEILTKHSIQPINKCFCNEKQNIKSKDNQTCKCNNYIDEKIETNFVVNDGTTQTKICKCKNAKLQTICLCEDKDVQVCSKQLQTDSNKKPDEIQKNIRVTPEQFNDMIDKELVSNKIQTRDVETEYKCSSDSSENKKIIETDRVYCVTPDKHEVLTKERVNPPKLTRDTQTDYNYLSDGSQSKKNDERTSNLKTIPNQVKRKRISSDNSSSSSSSLSSTSIAYSIASQSSNSLKLCSCCKRKNVKFTNLSKKLNEQMYPLCHPCYKRNVNNRNFHITSGHICNCYTVVETKTINEIKQTINDLNQLDLNEEYCNCKNSSKIYNNKNKYCQICKCKLRIRNIEKKNSLAYMLTFEYEDPKKMMKKKMLKKQKSLEEIRIKIPLPHHNKKHKDYENRKRRSNESLESLGKGEDKNGKAVKICSKYTLQEYLIKNKPNFVQLAEQRRISLLSAQAKREENKEKNKLLICQNLVEPENFKKPEPKKHIFSSKEMREITRKNYQKLPEVQRKYDEIREKQIKCVNRLMLEIFNKKLQQNVLKGKRNLPTEVNVITLCS